MSLLPDQYLLFHENDLLLDAQSVAQAVLARCRQTPGLLPAAVCQAQDELVVILTQRDGLEIEDLRWQEQEQLNMTTLLDILHVRWQADYEPVGNVNITHESGSVSFLLLLKTRTATISHA